MKTAFKVFAQSRQKKGTSSFFCTESCLEPLVPLCLNECQLSLAPVAEDDRRIRDDLQFEAPHSGQNAIASDRFKARRDQHKRKLRLNRLHEGNLLDPDFH